ncbi:hypothetical protein EVAR_26996_1 [Eumeta japonica]|uniref:Uncharacterized protein n=1 Tax=Eumeta variegata TaxID=151549 RepID=A0A4C1VL29_EUMVA|nr:hypothetical protein EVAR_26996_1 [Eumeta japonica]
MKKNDRSFGVMSKKELISIKINGTILSRRPPSRPSQRSILTPPDLRLRVRREGLAWRNVVINLQSMGDNVGTERKQQFTCGRAHTVANAVEQRKWAGSNGETSPVRYLISSKMTGNSLVTPLWLRTSMGYVDYIVSGASHNDTYADREKGKRRCVSGPVHQLLPQGRRGAYFRAGPIVHIDAGPEPFPIKRSALYILIRTLPGPGAPLRPPERDRRPAGVYSQFICMQMPPPEPVRDTALPR